MYNPFTTPTTCQNTIIPAPQEEEPEDEEDKYLNS